MSTYNVIIEAPGVVDVAAAQAAASAAAGSASTASTAATTATTQATNAAASASTASTAATTATTQAGIATTKAGEAAADAATAAADAASTAADREIVTALAAAAGMGAIYQTDAAGLAAVGEGGYYLLAPTTGGLYLRQDLSGVATAIATIQTGDGFLQSTYEHGVGAFVIRQATAGAGWSFINDADHAPEGGSSVTVTSGEIVVTYGPTFSKIGALLVQPDETFAASDITVGASVGKTSAILSVFAPFEIYVSGTASSAPSYLDLGGNCTATCDSAAGTWTITHPAMTHELSQGSPVIVDQFGEDLTKVTWQCIARSKTGFTMQSFQHICGRTSGGTIITEGLGTYTRTWNGTDTDTIVTPTSPAANDLVVSAYGTTGRYIPVVASTATGSFTVKYWDIVAGAFYTGATRPSGAEFLFQRQGLDKCAITGSTKGLFRRDRIKIDAADLYNAGGNFWASYVHRR